MTRRANAVLLVSFGAAVAASFGPALSAHKTVTSKYTFTEHVLPILRERCGSCHVEGGPTPMSLSTYKDALPWAQSIREELTTERMPPWYVDPAGPPIKNSRPITSREIDVILTWATGGAPEGPPMPAQERATPPPPRWAAGPPDVTLKMDAAHVVPTDVNEEVVDLSFATNLTEEKWVRGADLLPGNVPLVREAQISVEDGPVLAAWIPGEGGVTAPDAAAFRLAPGVRVHARIRYKKRWQDERTPQSDRSEVGLYFTSREEARHAVQTLVLDGSPPADSSGARTLTATLGAAARVLAVRPGFDRAYGQVEVNAIDSTGRTVPLLKLRSARAEWRRRYWLVEPAGLPAGSRIQVVLRPPDVAADDPRIAAGYPLQIAIEYVAN